MCGIAGAISFDKIKIEKKLIPNLIKSIKHRGPDHDDWWLSKNQSVLMINTRLSILDLTKNGNQPFYISIFFQFLRNPQKPPRGIFLSPPMNSSRKTDPPGFLGSCFWPSGGHFVAKHDFCVFSKGKSVLLKYT